MGVDIVLNEAEISGAPSNNGTYVLEGGVLNFNTSAGTNSITVGGTIKNINGGDISSSTLLRGSFSDFNFFDIGGNFIFSGIGPDTKDDTLLATIGLSGSSWVYGSTELGGDWNGTWGPPTTVAGVTNTTIPIPSSLFLLGTGLIGLVGISRRQVFGGFFKG